jgi:hypothetical protein
MRLKPAVLDLSVQFGAAHMNPLTAASEGISEYGGGLAFRAALSVFDVVSFSALTGLLAVNDRRTYTEQVVSEGSPNGKPQSRESIIEIGRHALALGPRTPPLCLDKHGDRCIAIAAFAEYGKVWVNGARKIQDCVNCTEQSLHLRDGQFVALGVDVGQRPNDGPSGMLVSATYRHTWPRVGLAQELLLGLEIAF